MKPAPTCWLLADHVHELANVPISPVGGRTDPASAPVRRDQPTPGAALTEEQISDYVRRCPAENHWAFEGWLRGCR